VLWPNHWWKRRENINHPTHNSSVICSPCARCWLADEWKFCIMLHWPVYPGQQAWLWPTNQNIPGTHGEPIIMLRLVMLRWPTNQNIPRARSEPIRMLRLVMLRWLTNQNILRALSEPIRMLDLSTEVTDKSKHSKGTQWANQNVRLVNWGDLLIKMFQGHKVGQ